MRTVILSISLAALAPTAALADKLGDHPAMVVQRLHANQGYDYASKFYPHPAWLYLAAEEPRVMNHHPAVTIARHLAEERAQALAKAKELLAGQPRLSAD